MSEIMEQDDIMMIDEAATAADTPVGTTIQLKTKTSTASATLLSSINLYRGEPLYNTNDHRLYIGVGNKGENGPSASKTPFYNKDDVDAIFTGHGNPVVTSGTAAVKKATIPVQKTTSSNATATNKAYTTLTSTAIQAADGVIGIVGGDGLTATRPEFTDADSSHGTVTLNVGAGDNIQVGDDTVALNYNPKITSVGLGVTNVNQTAPVTLQYDSTLKALKFVFN